MIRTRSDERISASQVSITQKNQALEVIQNTEAKRGSNQTHVKRMGFLFEAFDDRPTHGGGVVVTAPLAQKGRS